MAIPKSLTEKFKIIEVGCFPEWLKANKKERLRICKKIGRYEATEIIKVVKKEVKF